MPTPRLRLGQLLVDARMITAAALEEVLAAQRSDGRRLGTLLVERGLINETQLTQILSHQLSVPWVSLLHIEFSRQLLNLVPREVADRFCLVPIYVRHVRNQGDTLYVAMDDPSNEDGLKACREHAGLPVRAMIAPPSDIKSAIRVYYGVEPSTAPGAPSTPAAPPSKPASTDAAREAPSTRREPAAVGETPKPPAEAATLEETPIPPAPAQPAARPSGEVSAYREPAPPASAPAPPAISEAEPVPAAQQPPAPAHDHAPEHVDGVAREQEVPAPEPPSPPTELPSTKQEGATDGPHIEAVEIDLDKADRLRAALEPPETPPPSSPAVPNIPRPRGRAPRMVSLTLLDGTTITLPAKRRARRPVDPAPEAAGVEVPPPPNAATSEPPPGEHPLNGLTARDLVLALRVVAGGADASEVLGENLRWEALFSALLSLLLKKHLIADWEFVDELKKQL